MFNKNSINCMFNKNCQSITPISSIPLSHKSGLVFSKSVNTNTFPVVVMFFHATENDASEKRQGIISIMLVSFCKQHKMPFYIKGMAEGFSA